MMKRGGYPVRMLVVPKLTGSNRFKDTYDVNGDNWEVARAKFSRLELFDSIRILGTEEFSYIVIERVNLSPALGHVRVGTAKAFVRCIVECIDGDISGMLKVSLILLAEKLTFCSPKLSQHLVRHVLILDQ